MNRITGLRGLCLAAVLGLFEARATGAGGPYQFYSLQPCRIVDTRGPAGPTGGPALTSGLPRNFPITGLCNVPATAKAAVLNVTLVGPTADGFVVIWPYGTTAPGVSTVNAAAWEPAIANGAIVPLAADPDLQISLTYGTSVPGTANVVLDVTGYFQ